MRTTPTARPASAGAPRTRRRAAPAAAPRLAWPLAAAAVFAAALGGCSRYRSPQFALVAVERGERTAEGQVLNFTLEADNANGEALPLRQATYALSIDNQTVFTGERSAGITARRFGVQRLTLPAVVPADRFDLSTLDAGGQRFRLSGEVEYQTPGELAEFFFDTGVRRTRAGLSVSGTLPPAGEMAPVEVAPVDAAPAPAEPAAQAP